MEHPNWTIAWSADCLRLSPNMWLFTPIRIWDPCERCKTSAARTASTPHRGYDCLRPRAIIVQLGCSIPRPGSNGLIYFMTKPVNICFIMAQRARPYSNQRVRSSVRHRLFLLTGSSLCSLLLRNYSTDFSNDDTNQLREQCRCATCTSFWHWPLHDCRSRSLNTSILGI